MDPRPASQTLDLQPIVDFVKKYDLAATEQIQKLSKENLKLAVLLSTNTLRRLRSNGKITEEEYKAKSEVLKGFSNINQNDEGIYFSNALLDNDAELVDKLIVTAHQEKFSLLRKKIEKVMGETPPKELQRLILPNAQSFQARYNQTIYSQSAAFYRIFFCDEMKPAVPVGDDLGKEALKGLNLSFGGSSKTSLAPIMTKAEEKPHVQEPCISCHKKLDPNKKIIDNDFSGKPITLIYEDDDGKEFQVAISSIDALIPTVQKDDHYKVCQIRKFWNWIIGENVPISSDRMTELKKIYDSTSSSIMSLIGLLTSQKEFYSDDHFQKLTTVANVRHIFSRCNRCHANENDMPSFTQVPMKSYNPANGDMIGHVEWLTEISTAIQLNHFGKNARMPLKGWTLNKEDFDNIGQWIFDLARNDQGKPTITESEREQILGEQGLKLFDSKTLNAKKTLPSFYKRWNRYLEFDDLISIMIKLFPGGNKSFTEGYGAFSYGFLAKLQALGTPNYLTGQPISGQPTQAYMQVLNALYPYKAYIISGPDAENLGLASDHVNRNFNTLPPKEKLETIFSLIDQLYGPNTISVFKRERIARETLRTVENSEINPYLQVSAAIYLLITRDEFLTF